MEYFLGSNDEKLITSTIYDHDQLVNIKIDVKLNNFHLAKYWSEDHGSYEDCTEDYS